MSGYIICQKVDGREFYVSFGRHGYPDVQVAISTAAVYPSQEFADYICRKWPEQGFYIKEY